MFGEEVFTVPKDVTARIRRNLAGRPSKPEWSGVGRFMLMSWNTDGIDERQGKDLILRTLAIAEQISRLQPVIVLLQEIIPPQLELLAAPQTLGQHYQIVTPDNPRQPYYCATLVHKRRASLLESRTFHFSTSQMGRHLLTVDVVVDGLERATMSIGNVHAESTKSEKAERVKQLAEAMVTIASTASASSGSGASAISRTACVAGDLNARDDEITTARTRGKTRQPGVTSIQDAWSHCGSPKNHEYTWDTSVNNNLGVLFKSRCRFDRCLFAAPPASFGSWRPASFELIGKEKVPGLNRFPSDHWGMVICWQLHAPGCTALPGASCPCSESSKSSAAGADAAAAAAAVGAAPVVTQGASVATTSSSATAGTSTSGPKRSIAAMLGSGSGSSLTPTSSTPADQEAERKRRREVAAAKAEARLKQFENRGIGDGKKVGTQAQAQVQAQAQSPADTQPPAKAPVAPSPGAFKSSSSPSPPPAGSVSTATSSSGPPEAAMEDDEDLKAAIALSLATEASASSNQGAGSSTQGSKSRTFFSKLVGTQNSGSAPIDLDLDD